MSSGRSRLIWEAVWEDRWHLGTFVLLVGAGLLLGQVLEHGSEMTSARYWLYRHQLALQSGTPIYPRRTAVVLLEDEDYWSEGFAGRSPVNREKLAGILKTLAEAGVQTIALDVDLRSPDSHCPGCDFRAYRDEDAELSSVMRRLCAEGHWLVVGTSVRFADGLYTEVPSLYTWAREHDPKGEYSCVTPGYLQLPHDLRQLPGQLVLANGSTVDSFAMAAEARLDKIAYQRALQAPDRGFLYSRYLSEADFGSNGGPYRFSGKTLADLAAKDPNGLRQALAGRVVLVGGAWHGSGIGQGARVDLYESPMGSMPGVFLHANYIEALDGERGTFAAMPDWLVRIIEVSLAIGLAVVAARNIHAGWKWLSISTTVLIIFVLTYVLLQNLGIFMDFLIPLCILLVHTGVEAEIAGRQELQHLRRLHAGEAHHVAKPR